MYEIYRVETPKSSQSLPGASSKGGLMLEGMLPDAGSKIWHSFIHKRNEKHGSNNNSRKKNQMGIGSCS